MRCPDCKGQGYIEPVPNSARPPLLCVRCEGKGVLPDPKPVRIRSTMGDVRKRRKP